MPDSSDKDEKAGPGAQRAAALLLGLGADLAGAIFQHLDETSVRRIAAGAKEIRKNPEAVPSALSHFVASLDKIGGDAEAGDRVLQADRRAGAGRRDGAASVRGRGAGR